MRIGLLIAFYEKGSEDGCQQATACDYQWKDGSRHFKIYDPQGQRRYKRSYIGLEKVRAHSGNVAYIVAYVISDNGWITRIIFWNARFYFTHEVRAHISRFGINTAANTRKQSDG